MSVQERIEEMISDQGMKPDWKPDVAYPLKIEHEGFETTLMIRKEDRYFDVVLPSSESYEPCLRINIPTTGDTAHIETVEINPTCQIPELHGGTWIMRMTNSLLGSLGIVRASIDDDARLNFGEYHPKIILLRIFQGRDTGWYQNFGYEPTFYQSESNKTYALEAMSQLRNLSASLIFGDPSFQEFSTKYPPGESNLGNYMISIWEKDRLDYCQIECHLRYTDGIWTPMIQTIDKLERGINDHLQD